MPAKSPAKRKRRPATKRNSPPLAPKRKRGRGGAKSTDSPLSTKARLILGMLRRKNGATIEEMTAATDWQAHSVRGFLSGTVRKKRKLNVSSKKIEGGARRYYVSAS